MKIGKKIFDLENNCYIMGILNVTPDSFSDGGLWNSREQALSHVEQMINEGAEIIDIGGESTRPNHTQISVEEEIERTAPIIEAVKTHYDIPISIDTYKYEVAEAAVKAGADMINDIWGLKYDNGEMARLIAENNLPCCLMHNRTNSEYNDFFEDMLKDMKKTLDIAKKAGIPKENIVIDPGVGFAKSYENNLEAIDRLDEFAKRLKYPVLLGISRKSVIGNTLGLPTNERLEGTLALDTIGVMKGACILRVHDVKENLRAAKMTAAVMKGYKRG